MSNRDFMKFFFGLMASLVALAVVLFVLAQIVGGKPEVAQMATDTDAAAKRIKPVGALTVSSDRGVADALIATANAARADQGQATFDASCVMCHGAGIVGAPKFGDKAAWKDRIAQGANTLYQHAINGLQSKNGFMPAKGGNARLTDADVKAAVDYMVSKSK